MSCKSVKFGKVELILKRGDLTQEDSDVIVNAANSSLLGGGGVDGAIHRAAGPTLLEECKEVVKKVGSCPPGEAVITAGGKLKAKNVVHTVGPIWRGGDQEEEQILSNAYRNTLLLADEKGARSIAFPSISTGVYGFPIEKAAPIALQTVSQLSRELKNIVEVRFILFSASDLAVYISHTSKQDF